MMYERFSNAIPFNEFRPRMSRPSSPSHGVGVCRPPGRGCGGRQNGRVRRVRLPSRLSGGQPTAWWRTGAWLVVEVLSRKISHSQTVCPSSSSTPICAHTHTHVTGAAMGRPTCCWAQCMCVCVSPAGPVKDLGSGYVRRSVNEVPFWKIERQPTPQIPGWLRLEVEDDRRGWWWIVQ